jgi:hypothetical protein
MAHEVPGQQSALLVQPPHAATHVVAPHTNEGEPPSGFGFGTHGALTPPSGPQQSALDAQPPPAFTHCAGAHRGTPTLSCLQVSIVSQLPAQQSQDELQLIVLSLQTSPLGLHETGLRQTPGVVAVAPWHVTLPWPAPAMFGPPQQSSSLLQRSPTTRHPLAGWQIMMPVGPNGAHAREQQPPPQAGSPPSLRTTPPSVPVPLHRTPSTMLQLADPRLGAGPQIPMVFPVATVQTPVQQFFPTEQASPDCPQNDEAWHVPPVQKPEQQSMAEAQPLPSVLHAALSAAHLPPTHDWLQQSPSTVHAFVSEVHVG